MFAIERRQKLVEIIAEANSITVSELSRRLGVSVVTIRKDLEVLENEGLVTRTYGGAIHGRSSIGSGEPEERSDSGVFSAVVNEAAKLVQPGQTIMMGRGKLIAELANLLQNQENLTIITNSLEVALKLLKAPSLDVILTGGIMRPRTMTMLGHLAERVIREIAFDLSFSEADGIHPTAGITSANIVEAGTEGVLFESSNRPVILAEDAAIGKIASTPIARLKPGTTVIVSGSPDGEMVRQLQDLGIEVIAVDNGSAAGGAILVD